MSSKVFVVVGNYCIPYEIDDKYIVGIYEKKKNAIFMLNALKASLYQKDAKRLKQLDSKGRIPPEFSNSTQNYSIETHTVKSEPPC